MAVATAGLLGVHLYVTWMPPLFPFEDGQETGFVRHSSSSLMERVVNLIYCVEHMKYLTHLKPKALLVKQHFHWV